MTATRYLICTDAAEVEAAKAVWGKSYTVISREQAMNGHLAEISECPIVLWPSPDTVDRERSFGRELRLTSPDVKLVRADVEQHLRFDVQVAMPGWNAYKLIEWLAADDRRRIEVLAPAEIVDIPETSVKVRKNAKSRKNSESPPASPLGEGDPATDASESPPGFPPDGAPWAGDSEPPWQVTLEAFEEAYKEASEQLSAEEAYQPYVSVEKAAGGPEWPEPLDLTRALYRGLPMPINLVPASLQPFVADNAARLGTNCGPVWFGVLGALAGLCSDSIKLQVKQNDDWKVHPSVWCLVIGGPSSGKSPALEVGMRWVQRKDAEKVVENTRKMKDYDYALKKYEDECTAARKNNLPRPPEPEAPELIEYWLNNGTREGAVRMLQHSRKFCYYLDEASAFITALDRYAQGGKGSGDREFWLSTWNSGPSKTSLASRTISIPNASAALCGGTTPSSMRSAAGGKLQSDGLLARFLICCIPDKAEGEDTVPDARAIAMYDRVLSNLIDMRHAATLKLSPDAASIYKEFCEDLTKRIRSSDSDEMSASLGKWYGTWGRLACIYALTECASHGQVPTDGHQISGAIAAQVTAFLRWQIGHQQQFYYEIMSNKVGRKFAQTVAKYILANEDLAVLNFRDHISRPHHKALDSLRPWEVKEAINTLINAAWLTPIGLKTNTYGVPASYSVNPKIRDMFHAEREHEKERRAAIREELQAMRDVEEITDA